VLIACPASQGIASLSACEVMSSAAEPTIASRLPAAKRQKLA
jgi:hypothetical protein